MKKILSLFFLISFAIGCSSQNNESVKVLQLNCWGASADKLFPSIKEVTPDILLLCEVRNHKMINDLKDSLSRATGTTYYGEFQEISTAIISKYPIIELSKTDREGDTNHGHSKAVVNISEQRFAIYSLHLDYLNYACFMPRGYSGATWKKLPEAVNNADTVITHNRYSQRDEQTAFLIADMQKERELGAEIIFGGDLNEPSHLDWTEETKDIRNHNGLVIEWDCSKMLYENGYKDAYRLLYPNPLTHPAFTWPAGTTTTTTEHLAWTEGVDDRDRIDFIYFLPTENLKLKSAAVFGPKEDFYMGKIQIIETKDNITTPKSQWYSDHKGMIAEFLLNE